MGTKVEYNNDDQRFELIIDGKLIGHTIGENEKDHQDGAIILENKAKEKGHTVERVGW